MKNLTINLEATIKEAMELLDRTAEKCLLVVDENNILLGTVTDGDIRRSILQGKSFSEKIENCFNPEPTTLQKGKYLNADAKTMLRDKKLNLIPVVDEEGKAVDYVTWSMLGRTLEKRNSSLKKVSVVIMSGGMGTRLEPFTKVLPKPLVPIHDKPIIEHIIERFALAGSNNFYLTLNYKAKILKAYFEELQPNFELDFIVEKEPLGTAGSLRFLDGAFKFPFFVTNCDIIVKSDYESIYNFHLQGSYDLTLVASKKEYIIPYGTCELTQDGELAYMNEKPKYDFLINTGLYVLSPDILKLIPKKQIYHITHLIEDVKKEGKKVGVFPINDNEWIDIGQWADYKKAMDVF